MSSPPKQQWNPDGTLIEDWTVSYETMFSECLSVIRSNNEKCFFLRNEFIKLSD